MVGRCHLIATVFAPLAACQAVCKHGHSEGVRDLRGMAREGRTWQHAHG